MISAGRWIGVVMIIASTAGESLGQFAFKRATTRPILETGLTADPFSAIWFNKRWIFLGFIGFITDGVLWSIALHFLDLTVAHPLGSVVFVIVALISKLLLRERLPARRWLGFSLVLAGAAIVAST